MPFLIRFSESQAGQTPEHSSFVGGRPKLPGGVPLPTCGRCGSVQTFFFQVAFPDGHAWAGSTLAVFQCTSCYEPGYTTPTINRELVPGLAKEELEPGDDIPDGALEAVQIACRFLAFPTAAGVIREDYSVKVAFVPLSFTPPPDKKLTPRSKVGGKPGWIWTDMSPGRHMGQPMDFLMQWERQHLFKTVPGAPLHAIAVDPHFPDDPVELDYYELFQGYQLYFFGNVADGRPHVYMVTQSL